MGLYRRGTVWWMTFTYQGRQVRATTGQADRRAAEMILGETRRQLHDGAYHTRIEAHTRTFGGADGPVSGRACEQKGQ